MTPVILCKEIEIAASPTAVWRYIGSAAGLSTWWQVEVTLEPHVGGAFFEQGVDAGHLYQRQGTVTVFEPPHRLCLALVETRGTEPPLPTALEIRLSGTTELTTVTVIHRARVDHAIATEQRAVETAVTGSPWHGPTMALPGAGVPTSAPQAIPVTASLSNQPTTLSYQAWQTELRTLWAQRATAFSSVVFESKNLP